MEQTFVSRIKKIKALQLAILSLITIGFFLTITFQKPVRDYIFSNPALILFSLFAWLMIVFSILFLILDFSLMRSIGKENHNLSQLAYLDSLTGIPNRASLDRSFEQFNTPEKVVGLGCVLLQISNIKEINESLGRSEGDKKMRDFCAILEKTAEGFGIIGRNGGNEFLCIMESSTDKKCEEFLFTLDAELAAYNVNHEGAPLSMRSASYSNNKEEKLATIGEIIAATYRGITR